ncbi:Hsp20/alpha crystallin family protein [Effusibacillus dendaii]|uniref:Heat-shock protein Hsp20 n=1 Tax=Effusibacillus dendaii TaxID=2743772 RepID=A0A7I8DJN3_9BACL|nr:Hsp20/alpha crystallin family protein [Effusibacillus dendaii]BCJ88071.1 heat-shock protein Hsp20 [Effusibacillus dendaii]
MPIVPYDPFNMIRGLFDENWFDTRFANMARVRVDVRENPTEVVVTAEIPGLQKKEDVNITVHDNHLHLSGKIERSSEEKGENVHRTERYYGKFSRTIALPSNVEETGSKASYKNGILEVRLPKAQKEIGKRIDVDFH